VTATDAATTPVDQFISGLEALSRNDSARGDLAKLRRCAGRALAESTQVFQLFYRLLPFPVREHEREEERYFLVATLFALNPKSSSARNFGATMAAVANSRSGGREGIDRRMAILLDASFDDLHFRLRQLVALAGSVDAGVNWRQLLSDILWWNHPARRVQKRWARSYFGGTAPAVDDQTASANPSESED